MWQIYEDLIAAVHPDLRVRQCLVGPDVQIGVADEVITEENLKSAYGIDVRVVSAGNTVDRKICFPTIEREQP